MAVPADQLMELVRHVTDRDSRQRELGADRTTDWMGSYSEADGRILVGVLTIAAASERDHGALEAQLHALLELGSRGFTDFRSLSRLREIDRDPLPSNLRDYVDDLLDAS